MGFFRAQFFEKPFENFSAPPLGGPQKPFVRQVINLRVINVPFPARDFIDADVQKARKTTVTQTVCHGMLDRRAHGRQHDDQRLRQATFAHGPGMCSTLMPQQEQPTRRGA
jgi:hypothetical protein